MITNLGKSRTAAMLCAAAALTAASAGCARKIGSGTYEASEVGEAQQTHRGVVRSSRLVTIENKDELEENGTGILIGGASGAAVGSAIGDGWGQIIAIGVGAVLGAAVGAVAESEVKQQTGLELVVEMEDGRLLTIVQGQDEEFVAGQDVFVTLGNGYSRARVFPAT